MPIIKIIKAMTEMLFRKEVTIQGIRVVGRMIRVIRNLLRKR